MELMQQISDLQAALRVLWPDESKVTFEPKVEEGVRMLTHDERQMLSRVALAIGAARHEGYIAGTAKA